MANNALEGQAWVAIGCRGDEDFDELYERLIAPYTDYDIRAAVLARLLEEGSYTLPDGAVLKLVVETETETETTTE